MDWVLDTDVMAADRADGQFCQPPYLQLDTVQILTSLLYLSVDSK
jgi:hypothetical protein